MRGFIQLNKQILMFLFKRCKNDHETNLPTATSLTDYILDCMRGFIQLNKQILMFL